MNFIELQRRFREVTDAELDNTEEFLHLDQQGYGPGIGWSNLLENARVVLLADAGAGKTEEMKERVKRLFEEDKYAFFIELESLDRKRVVDLLSPAAEKRFEEWKAHREAPAWFLLDAVDELKLTGGKLDGALLQLSKDIDGHIDHARVIISCRPSDWRPSTDLATVKYRLPVPTETPVQSSDEFFASALSRENGQATSATQGKAKAPGSEAVRTVAMLPLNDAQIKRFAEQSGVADATAFLEEIRWQNARTFAGRPLDLSNLIGNWMTSGRLGTRSEQHETNVASKLKDDPQRRDRGVLANDKARLGAERLALALTLTRTRFIRSPEQALDIQRADGVLDAAEILHDWTEAEHQTLLRRALFDPATYGRVRFHHRSVQEYLAAQHLRRLREQGMSTRALLRLMFAEKYGVEVVIPSMCPIAAWLALWNDAVRKELIQREPEALLSLGDPETVDFAAKKEILRRFAEEYGEGSWRGLNIPIDGLRAFARPELGPVIRACWGNGPVNEDVRDLLVRTIWLGPVPDCADLAQAVAFDATWSIYDRIAAIRSLVACGWDDAVRQIADDMLAEPGSWPDKIVCGVAGDLFPKVLTVDELVALMERTPEPANTVSGFEWTSLEIVEDLNPRGESAVSLRDKLVVPVKQSVP